MPFDYRIWWFCSLCDYFGTLGPFWPVQKSPSKDSGSSFPPNDLPLSFFILLMIFYYNYENILLALTHLSTLHSLPFFYFYSFIINAGLYFVLKFAEAVLCIHNSITMTAIVFFSSFNFIYLDSFLFSIKSSLCWLHFSSSDCLISISSDCLIYAITECLFEVLIYLAQ